MIMRIFEPTTKTLMPAAALVEDYRRLLAVHSTGPGALR